MSHARCVSSINDGSIYGKLKKIERKEEKEGEKRGTPRGRRHRATPFQSVHHRRKEATAIRMPRRAVEAIDETMIDQVVVPAAARRDDDRACWSS